MVEVSRDLSYKLYFDRVFGFGGQRLKPCMAPRPNMSSLAPRVMIRYTFSPTEASPL